jgi:hypothetical protein
MQWVQGLSQSNIDNLNKVKLADVSGAKKKYRRAKILELETNSKIKNIRDLYRGINDFNL